MSQFVFPRTSVSVRPNRVVLALLDAVGDGSGSTAMNVNGSEAAAVFRYNAPAGYEATVERITIAYADSANPIAEKYGGRAELTNGVQVGVYDTANALVLPLTPVAIKSNAGWGSVTCSREAREDYGSGNNFWSYCWLWSEGGSVLTLPSGYSIRATVADDLSGMVSHTISVKGYLTGSPT